MRVGRVKLIWGVVLVLGVSVTLYAQDLAPMSNREACDAVRSASKVGKRLGYGKLHGEIDDMQLTPTGFVWSTKSGSRSFEYANLVTVHYESDVRMFPSIRILTSDSGDYLLRFARGSDPQVALRFARALNYFRMEAKVGRPVDCASPPPNHAAELADFAKQAAAWRAMNPKPPLSDEVEKKRLLAEDAVEQNNLGAAVRYYEAGVALSPTWPQGWYNAALLYAEQRDYEHAAFDMKHYLILLPDAPDAAAAKQKVLLWEAKAEEAAGK